MLVSPVTREVSRTVLLSTDQTDIDERLTSALDTLEASARSSMIAEGANELVLTAERWVDARYRGQSFELGVPADDWVHTFHTAHGERYGYERPETSVEAVTIRVVVTAPAVELVEKGIEKASIAPTSLRSRVVIGGQELEAQTVWRSDLLWGHELRGPTVVQEYSGTTWVPPEWTVSVDRWGCLHLVRDR
jgi:N-methylhydantoinase A